MRCQRSGLRARDRPGWQHLGDARLRAVTHSPGRRSGRAFETLSRVILICIAEMVKTRKIRERIRERMR